MHSPYESQIGQSAARSAAGRRAARPKGLARLTQAPVYGAPPMKSTQSASRFTAFAKATARLTGRPAAFATAAALVVAWALSGPLFGFSDTWQLIINTSTTIATFLMVFLIQNTQNRDSQAIHVKLDELIRVTEGAHKALLDLEELTDEELEKIRASYERLASDARKEIPRRKRARTS